MAAEERFCLTAPARASRSTLDAFDPLRQTSQDSSGKLQLGEDLPKRIFTRGAIAVGNDLRLRLGVLRVLGALAWSSGHCAWEQIGESQVGSARGGYCGAALLRGAG